MQDDDFPDDGSDANLSNDVKDTEPSSLMFDFADVLPHLRRAKRVELERACHILFEEFEDYRTCKTSERRRMGRILHVILFGSFTGSKWVEDHDSGYMSDYDLLIVVNHDEVAEDIDPWDKAENRILRDPRIKREVNFIVHSMNDLNGRLAEGRYFFVDIIREGIPLYSLKGHAIGPAKSPDPTVAYEQAQV